MENLYYYNYHYIFYRRLAVGDQLRSVYDGLARDPNSLANLDQDLPNYAQHAVPIHSLPQEWLWCETWCSDDSKEKVCSIYIYCLYPNEENNYHHLSTEIRHC